MSVTASLNIPDYIRKKLRDQGLNVQISYEHPYDVTTFYLITDDNIIELLKYNVILGDDRILTVMNKLIDGLCKISDRYTFEKFLIRNKIDIDERHKNEIYGYLCSLAMDEW